MKEFIEYYSDHEIIKYLCRARVKLAASRRKRHLLHMLTSDKNYNYHKKLKHSEPDVRDSNQELLSRILPPRRLWKKPGREARRKLNENSGFAADPTGRNEIALMNTVKYYLKYDTKKNFVAELNRFIADVRESVADPDYSFSAPGILPQLKEGKAKFDGGSNICRPLSLFSLKDSLISSFTARFLTDLFDRYYKSCSLAFRKSSGESKSQNFSQHTAIERIRKFRLSYPNKPLWVSECDIKKFFDCLNHEDIQRKFDKLISLVEKENPALELKIPVRIFKSYLACYSFSTDVLQLNEDPSYWKKFNIPKGIFDWVEEGLKSNGYYDANGNKTKDNFFMQFGSFFRSRSSNERSLIEKSRIGIPQGGAISGVIANILLNDIDNKLCGKNRLLYLRYCDDIIMIHPRKTLCSIYMNEYTSYLKKCRLVYHDFVNCKKSIQSRIPNKYNRNSHSSKSFWNQKSKKCYKWDSIENGGFTWIGFVGYEININGDIRVSVLYNKK